MRMEILWNVKRHTVRTQWFNRTIHLLMKIILQVKFWSIDTLKSSVSADQHVLLDWIEKVRGNGWPEESVALKSKDWTAKTPWKLLKTLTLSRKLALFIKSVTRGESSVILVVFSLHFSPNRIRYAKLNYILCLGIWAHLRNHMDYLQRPLISDKQFSF